VRGIIGGTILVAAALSIPYCLSKPGSGVIQPREKPEYSHSENQSHSPIISDTPIPPESASSINEQKDTVDDKYENMPQDHHTSHSVSHGSHHENPLWSLEAIVSSEGKASGFQQDFNELLLFLHDYKGDDLKELVNLIETAGYLGKDEVKLDCFIFLTSDALKGTEYAERMNKLFVERMKMAAEDDRYEWRAARLWEEIVAYNVDNVHVQNLIAGDLNFATTALRDYRAWREHAKKDLERINIDMVEGRKTDYSILLEHRRRLDLVGHGLPPLTITELDITSERRAEIKSNIEKEIKLYTERIETLKEIFPTPQ